MSFSFQIPFCLFSATIYTDGLLKYHYLLPFVLNNMYKETGKINYINSLGGEMLTYR